MAKAGEEFRSSDITLWGIVALCCGGFAVLSANISAVIPQSVFAGLHATRLEGGTVNQLRAEVATMQEESAALKRANIALLSRFDLAEHSDGEMLRRVAALEMSIPNLLEALPAGADVDRSALTASVDDGGAPAVNFDVDGGSVSVQQKPLVPETASSADQPLPPLAAIVPESDPNAFGIALGPAMGEREAVAAWSSLNAKVGTLLLGLAPLLANDEQGKRLVAGPLRDAGQAAALCRQMSLVGITCAPVPFVGEPLAN